MKCLVCFFDGATRFRLRCYIDIRRSYKPTKFRLLILVRNIQILAKTTAPRVFHQTPRLSPDPAFSTMPRVFHTPKPYKHTRGPWPCVFHQARTLANRTETAKTSKNLNKPKKVIFTVKFIFEQITISKKAQSKALIGLRM